MDAEDNKIAIEYNSLLLKYLATQKSRNIADAVSLVCSKSILKDESYCQAMKYTLGNNNIDECKLAWEWITMLSLAFNPSDGIYEILNQYLSIQGIEHPTQSIAILARHCLLQISRRNQHGPRSQLPVIKEYESIIDGALYQSIKIRINSSNSISLIDSCSTCSEVSNKIATETLRLSSFHDYFGLMLQIEKGFDVPLDVNSKVADLSADKDILNIVKPPITFSYGVQVWNFRFSPDMENSLLDALYNDMRFKVLNSDISCALNKVLDLAAFMSAGSQLGEANK